MPKNILTEHDEFKNKATALAAIYFYMMEDMHYVIKLAISNLTTGMPNPEFAVLTDPLSLRWRLYMSEVSYQFLQKIIIEHNEGRR